MQDHGVIMWESIELKSQSSFVGWSVQDSLKILQHHISIAGGIL